MRHTFLAALVVASTTLPALADGMIVYPNGSRPSVKGPEATFSGPVRVDMLFADPKSPISVGHVTFEPGSRSAWHTHPDGQILIITSGVGWVQEWGGQKREVRTGDVIWTPPGVKHWHGASDRVAMSHTAITGIIGGKNVDWMEKVPDEHYAK